MKKEIKTVPAQIFEPIKNYLDQECQVIVAFSGGIDSSVLLDLTLKMIPLRNLLVIHVNHGLSAKSIEWEKHSKQICEAFGVKFIAEKVNISGHGKGLEAAARSARYKVFEKHLVKDGVLLQGHHFDDQVETVLYRLLRGSGSKGLTGIPKLRKLAHGMLFRPLLGMKKIDIQNYAEANGLKWVEDDSNQSSDFDRNYIRNSVLPVITKRWPDYHSRFDTLIRNSRANKQLSMAVFKQDLKFLDQKKERGGYSILLKSFAEMDKSRQKNFLLYWADSNGMQSPGHKVIGEAINSLATLSEETGPIVSFRDSEYRRYRDRLFLLDTTFFSDLETLKSQTIIWNGESRLDLDPVSHLNFEKSLGFGVRYPKGIPVIIKFRQGGERSHPQERSHSNTLKKCLQEFGLEPWWRDYVPLIYYGSELVAVADLWIQKDWQADADQDGLNISWISNIR